VKDNPNSTENENSLFSKALMLAIAYSASIGGMATLIGTPPNMILAGVIEESYGVEISFFQWFSFGLPLSIVLLFIAWVYLTKYAFNFDQKEFPGGKNEIEKQLKRLGKISYEEKSIFYVFVLTAFAWISRKFLLERFIPNIDDTIIAICAAFILFLLPSSKRNEPLIRWDDAVKLPWGILILFGGGMALATGFEESGLALWVGSQLQLLETVPIIMLLLIVITAVNFITEITSNMATTAILLPVLASLASAIGVNPYLLLVGATVAASCAFMLPVATPPNAVVFGSGHLEINDMVKKGFWMNIASIIILTFVINYLLPMAWKLS
jgi:sodium-dependent dicarboxylate transporter 2/3/5